MVDMCQCLYNTLVYFCLLDRLMQPALAIQLIAELPFLLLGNHRTTKQINVKYV